MAAASEATAKREFLLLSRLCHREDFTLEGSGFFTQEFQNLGPHVAHLTRRGCQPDGIQQVFLLGFKVRDLLAQLVSHQKLGLRNGNVRLEMIVDM